MDSFVPTPPGTDFPLANLPWGAVTRPSASRPTLAVALGDAVVDVGELARAGLLATGGPLGDGAALTAPTLNAFLALGPPAWRDARAALTRLLAAGEGRLRDDVALRDRVIVPAASVATALAVAVGDFTDFYASREHAAACGALFRDPAHALHPNWTRLPVGYAGRASTIVASGTPVRRPLGQLGAPPADAAHPLYGPCAALDYELEVAAVIGGAPNPVGDPVPVADAAARVFGYALLNDWSARDVQAWEATPLGPFNGKNFGTTLGAWIVTADALAPYRVDAPAQRPPPLPYLDDAATPAGRCLYDVELTAEIVPAGGARGTVVTRSNLKHLYWTFPQMIAHHTVGGCSLQPGDVLGSGTVSGPGARGAACLLEATRRGRDPVALDCGGSRVWLEDGDEVVLRGRCGGLGWGEARGVVVPARR